MASLSKIEAEETANIMLPRVRKEIETSEISSIRMQDIGKIHPAVRRELLKENIPTEDMYCKIADAMFTRGIATDVNIIGGFHVLKFRNSGVGDYPTPKRCKDKWRDAKILEGQRVKLGMRKLEE